ncbi:hypothetical protein [Niallia endozanthoxylica]|uniref:hypothetical protein n=1 Tax=Niallia endozanthoxylica TaxID=2036016 RepID=UPI00168BA096|nr:hypothetical protein [Niallia endozanthoxylica]
MVRVHLGPPLNEMRRRLLKLRVGGEPVLQIPVLDLLERIEAAEKLGAEARQNFIIPQ